MTGPSLFPVFLIGLLGSVHCVGMCGGIVGALSVAAPRARPFPVAVMTAASERSEPAERLWRVASYNAGRIGSYAIAGAIVGGAARGAQAMTGLTALQVGGYWLANLMLVALGLYLMDAWRGLSRLESLGQSLWRHIQPLTKRLLPLDSPLKMLAMGGLWGWLPCGMVYSVLLTAMLTGSALSGASVMLAFGLGTLPTLLAMGLAGAQLRQWMQRRVVRVLCGLVVLLFGVAGLMRVAAGMPLNWLDAVCITPMTAVAP
ncbi:sulfite exporter TauE/SafE [Actimicrobium sp. GrIS 1.19]|uniref:sulfite exporter TauE/SafE family protein n=1 Tax=Actimicrobium sp. GrIS 1.19 TaxID=3071708 RepID=UPI002DFBC03D|nr:sulfite exporter TauE/SafE [Actimicrobium sp. GrIS 1.19]